MISEAQEMVINIFILPGDLNAYFNEFLRSYFKNKAETIEHIQKIFFPKRIDVAGFPCIPRPSGSLQLMR